MTTEPQAGRETNKSRLTATQLGQFYSCPLMAYNRAHCPERREKPEPFRQRVMERGIELERAAVKVFRPIEVECEPADPRAGAARTAALLSEGLPALYQPVFFARDNRFEYVAKPDLVVRVDGVGDEGEPLDRGRGIEALSGDGLADCASDDPPDVLFSAAEGPVMTGGGPIYRVVEIKHSRAVTPEHILQLVFSAELLNRAQGVAVRSHQVLLAGRGTETFDLEDYRAWVSHHLDEARAVIAAPGPPAFISKRMCAECEWRRACFDRAREMDLPGRAFGMTHREMALLEKAGIGSLSALAERTEIVDRLEDIPEERRRLFAARARALTAHRDHRVARASVPKEPFLLHLLKDDLEAKDLVGWAGAFREGPVRRFTGTGEEARGRLAELLSGEVSVRQVVTTTEIGLELLRDEVIYPRMGPAAPRIVADLPHLTSLEGIAARTLALDLDVYDFGGLYRHFRPGAEPAPPPEQVYALQGGGEAFDRACADHLKASWRLYDAILGVPGDESG